MHPSKQTPHPPEEVEAGAVPSAAAGNLGRYYVLEKGPCDRHHDSESCWMKAQQQQQKKE